MDFLADLAKAGVFTALFAILGWGFVYANSRALARQGEVNSITAFVEKMLQEIADETNKFWKASASGEPDPSSSKLYNAFIVFRCNFIEDKVRLMNERSRSAWHGKVKHEVFEDDVVDIIAKIRDAATLDSEDAAGVADKYARVIEVNYLSQSLYSTIHDFLRVRYMDGNHERYHDPLG
ncbi:hypothetical protein [Stutzerimonas nitrititolerans]|uniref:hypothetical protein n=1 Tax=Stutzerimonas nitrititolerans TaxID=2482751 RepID=UPI0028A79390|nr:hypothetical protein [Stutzerimonas nitrititolerans]